MKEMLKRVLDSIKAPLSGEATVDRFHIPSILCLQDDYFEQSTRPETSDPSKLERLVKSGDYRMKFRKGCKKITIFRYLLSKLLFDDREGIHLDEYLAFSHLYFLLREEKDPSFRSKWVNLLERKHPFFEKVFGFNSFPIRLDISERELSYIIHYLEDLPLTRSAFFGMKGNRNIRDSFRLSFDHLQSPSFPPPRFVGVGYQDKGTCRNIAEDASPSWVEVGQLAAELERVAIESGLTQLPLEVPSEKKGIP